MKLKKGEMWMLVAMVFFVSLAAYLSQGVEKDYNPYYQEITEASEKGHQVYRKYECYKCHRIIGMGHMPGPKLDGLSNRRSREWLKTYLTSENPQKMIPSRFKKEFQMPSYATMPNSEMNQLLDYLGSLKMKEEPNKNKPQKES